MPSFDELVLAMKSADEGERRRAATALAELGREGDPRAVGALTGRLWDASFGVKVAIIDAVGKVPGPAAEDALWALVQDSRHEGPTRGHALVALARRRGQLEVIEELGADKQRSTVISRKWARALAATGDPRASPLLRGMLVGGPAEGVYGSVSATIKLVCIRFFAALGDASSAEIIAEALADADVKVKQAASAALVALGGVAVPAALAAIEAEDDDTQREAAAVLGQIGDPRAIPALLERVMRDWYDIAQPALVACGPEGVRALCEADLDDDEREFAAGLVLSAASDPFPMLAEILRAHPGYPRTAVFILGESKDPRAARLLLDAHAGAHGGPPLEMTGLLAQSLGQIGDREATLPLLAALETIQPLHRWSVTTALGELGDARALPALIAVLAGDEDRSVRQSAANALGLIGDRGARPALERAAAADTDEDVRSEARRSLARLSP